MINEAHVSQPACTAIQLALTDLLRSWGVAPTAVTGHSSGEIAAAYAANILPLDSCMAASYHRGMVTKKLKKMYPDLKGSMMAVGCTKEEIAPLIDQLTAKDVRIACFNSPTSLTISGDEPAIDELQIMLEKRQLFNRKLQVDVAYHSHHMKLVAKEYRETLRSLEPPKSTTVKFYSSLFGHIVDGSKLEPSYWVDNLTQSVRFTEALTSMCGSSEGHKTGVNMIVEIGPHSALAGPIKQILKACGANAMKIPYASALIRKKDAVETALDLASTLFVKGANLDFGAINLAQAGKLPALLVDMPRYPWNHQTKYWHESRMMLKHKNRATPRNDLLGTLANYSNDLEPTWRNVLRVEDLPWLRHHKVQSLILFPMSGFVAMAVEAASQRATSRGIQYDSFELRNVSVNNPLMMTDDDVEMTLQLRPFQEGTLIASDHWDEFRIHSWAANKGWTEHCKGLIAVKGNDCEDLDTSLLSQASHAPIESAIAEMVGAKMTSVDRTTIYDSLSELGVSYGSSFQGMNNCEASDSCSTASITAVDTAQEMPQGYQTSMIIHPAFLEQLIEMYWPIFGAGRTTIDTVYLPSSIGHMSISRQITELTKNPGDSLRAFCKGVAPTSYPRPTQVSMFAATVGDSKTAVITLDDLTISPIVERDLSLDSEIHRELCYKLDWEPILDSVEDAQSNDTEMSNGVTNGVSHQSNGIVNETSNGVNDKPNGIARFHDGGLVIIRGESESQIQLASKLADALEHSIGQVPEVGTLMNTETDGKLCLVLSELEAPLLSSLTANQFTALQKVLTKVDGIFWVVRGAYASSSNPDTNMITGLSRSIRSETLLKFSTLDLDSEHILSEEGTVNAILKVFTATFGPKAEKNCELEFMERKGMFLTPRIINDAEMNEYVHKQTKAYALQPSLFAQEGRPLQMAIGNPGSFDSLHFVDQSVSNSILDDEIEIEVKAIGMNSMDVTVAMGQLDTHDLGLECSGTVTKVGTGVSNFEVGNRVSSISLAGGVYSTYARTKADLTFRINDDTSFESAASIPVAFCTAHYGIIDLARLLEGERVLVFGADSAAGQATISLAQMIGAQVFATVSTAENKDLLKKAYGLHDEQFISSHKSGLTSSIRQATASGLFDVVVKCISTDPDTLRDICSGLSKFGRFIEMERQNTGSRLDTSLFENNRSFMSVDFISLATERPKVMRKLLSDVSELFKRDLVRPACLTTVFPISDVETAFKVLQSGNVAGKLIVAPQPGNEVKVCDSSFPRIDLWLMIS